MVKFNELWKLIKVPVSTIIEGVIAVYSPADMKTMLVTCSGALIIILDAVIQYYGGEKTK